MPYTAVAKNTMLNALGSLVTHMGLYRQSANISVTGTQVDNVITSAAHGLSNGDVVVPTALTGGASLLLDEPYFVISTATNTFQVSKTVGGSAATLGTDISAGTFVELTEATGGTPAYARKPITLPSAADGAIAYSGVVTFDVPGGITVSWASFHSALTVGTLYGVSNIADEAFSVDGNQYIITAATLDLNA